MSLIQPLIGSNLVGAGAASFDSTLIGNSVWLDGAADFFSKSSFAGHASKKVISVWVQRTGFSSFGLIRGTNSTGDRVGFGDNVSNNQVYVVVNGKNLYSNRIFRDIGWYHYLISFDLTQSTASDKVKVYINGVDLDTSGGWQTDERSTMSSSFATFDSSSVAQQIGRDGSGAMYLKAYLAQYCELDGQSIQSGDVATTDFYGTYTFGTNGSQIIPKANSAIAALATTAGSNSFCLDFADSSDLGNDISTNNNDFTPTSMSSANQSSNSPSKTYPILNVLDPTTATAANGNRDFAGPSADNKAAMRTTIGIPDNSGKFYWEYFLTGGSNNAFIIGIAGDGSANGGYDDWMSDITPSVGVYTESSSKVLYENGSATSSTVFGSSPTGGDVIGVAYDSDSRKVWFALNNTYSGSGDPAAGSGETATLSGSGAAFPTVSARGSSDTLTLRFDSGDFTYSAPTGFNDLNTANLTAPTHQGIDHFNTVLYTGNGTAIGSGGKAVTGTGFQPDWVWIKNRDATDSHAFYDVVRGTTKQIESDTTVAESTESEGLTTFGSDGFTVGNLAQVSTSSEDYVAWQWLASNSTATNTDGSVNTTVSASSVGHFSVVKGTTGSSGATFGHGLGAAPELILNKRLGAGGWLVYSKDAGSNNYLQLNATAAAQANSTVFGSDATSTVFTLGSFFSSVECINYCFRSVPGVCAVGSYEGNASSDGTYVSLGFKPAFVLFKSVDSTSDWQIFDKSRNGFNVRNNELEANDTAVEDTSTNFLDLLSDGFKLRIGSDPNVSETFLYLAMAEIAGGGTAPPIYGR